MRRNRLPLNRHSIDRNYGLESPRLLKRGMKKPFLIRGLGDGSASRTSRLSVALSLKISLDGLTADIACCGEKRGRGPQAGCTNGQALCRWFSHRLDCRSIPSILRLLRKNVLLTHLRGKDVPSAESRNLFDNGKQRFLGAAKVTTNTFSQKLPQQQSIGV